MTSVAVPPKRTSTFSRIDNADLPIVMCLLSVGVLNAISPILRAVSRGFSFDRACDALSVLIVGWAILEFIFRRRNWKLKLPVATLIFAIYFSISVVIAISHDDFNWFLVFIEAKIFIFLLGGVFLTYRGIGRQSLNLVVNFLYGSFMFGALAFLAVGRGRLTLLNESNYVVAALAILSLVLLRVRDVRIFSLIWWAVYGAYILVCIVAQSRTGFLMGAVYFAAAAIVSRRLVAMSAVVCLSVVIGTLFIDRILLTVSRGAIGGGVSIDRLVFLNEYLVYASARSWFALLFEFNVGKPLDTPVAFMHWWVAKESLAKGLPYAVSPFNFHSAILRFLSAYGFIPTLSLMLLCAAFMRSAGWFITVAVMISAASMSIFYLSSVVPFLFLAILAGPYIESTGRQGR